MDLWSAKSSVLRHQGCPNSYLYLRYIYIHTVAVGCSTVSAWWFYAAADVDDDDDDVRSDIYINIFPQIFIMYTSMLVTSRHNVWLFLKLDKAKL